jgi:DNA-binding beta-propeller fold protein YncE
MREEIDVACRGTVGVVFSAFTAALLLTGFARKIPVAPGPSGYHILKTIPVGGTEGWDYLTMDSASRRLYIGRSDHIQVVDVEHGTVVGNVAGLRGTHGMALALDLGRGFTTDGGANTVTIVDLKTLKKIGTVKAGKDPDSFAYDDVTKRVFIMNSAGNDATAINASDGTIAGTIALGGQPEFVVADGRGKIFINITDKDQIVEVEGRTLKILHRWPIAPCDLPSGLAMDQKNRRLFAACDNQMMAILNADTGKIVATPTIDQDPDAAAFDPETQFAFSSNGGSGTLTIIHEDSPDNFSVVDNVPTQSGARTMAVDTKTHNVLLVTAKRGHGSTASAVVPNTFVVLVVGK